MLCYLNPTVLHTPEVFLWCPFPVPWLHPEYHLTFSLHVSLASFDLWQFFRFWFWWLTLAVLRRVGQLFFWMSLNETLFYIFLMIRLKLQVSWETTEIKCYSHGYQLSWFIVLSTWFISDDAALGCLPEVKFVKSLHCQITFSPLHIIYSLEVGH